MKLIVGLGNPGAKYEGTRHNVGFDVLDRLAMKILADPGRSKFDAIVKECRLGGEKALLLWPQTFMNRSGSSVRKAIDFFQIDAGDLLVVCDEFQLPLGALRFRPQGSAGGHNGLADVIQTMGTPEFARLRLGIGPVPERWDPADFVLGQFAAGERAEADRMTAKAVEAIVEWAAVGVTAAMNKFNSN